MKSRYWKYNNPSINYDKKFIGIPYALGGKSFGGADCVGVAILWLKEQGVNLEYDDGMGPVMAHWWEHNPRRFVDAFHQLGNQVKFSELKKYDCLLLIGNEQVLFPSCLGIMVDDRHFLVSMKETGSFVTMLDLHWKSMFWAGIRLHKITERFGV